MDYYLICCKGSLCAKHAAMGNELEEIIYFLAGLLTTELQTQQKLIFMTLNCLQTILVKGNPAWTSNEFLFIK